MAEKKLNIGNLVTPNGASMIFGTEASDDSLSLKTEHDETWNPYTIVIDEEIDENIPANIVDYDPPANSILTATTVEEAINQLADSLDDVGGAFYAEYGTTSLSDVKEAYNAGKNIIARVPVVDDGMAHTIDFPLVVATSQENIFIFSATMGTTSQAVVLSASGWEEAGSVDLVTTNTLATLDTYGITLLSGATNSTANNVAATSSAVKAAYDLAASKTSNTGTITEVKANGTSVATSGVANIPAASTSAYGVTKLSSSTSSTSTTLAATASAVKSAYDLANAAMPKSGGTFTGAISNNITTEISSSVGYYRPIRVSMFEPTATDGNIGDIWVVYSNG